VAKPSRSAHFVSIALRASNVLRLGLATAALHCYQPPSFIEGPCQDAPKRPE
jgi:hypothetical protein